jgi:hypothetical protein
MRMVICLQSPAYFEWVEELYFSQVLHVHRVNDFRQREKHTTEPLVPDPSPFEVEIACVKLKKYKMPSFQQK